ncbi:MAG: hypothetical protein IIB06_06850 [Bacteroidetes bacterium]|nr:hypothetical protein [Bacteroidota bacterium]
MKTLICFLILSGFFLACDDGDIIVTTFNFDEANLNNCGGPGNYIFFKINNNTSESISLSLGTSDILFIESGSRVFVLNGTSNIVNYRIYNGDITNSYFCNSIPPISPDVITEFIGSSGEATLVTDVTLDDMDGIVEDSTSSLDTDEDSLLDFYDEDDDGDNVPTIIELGTDFLNGISKTPQDTDKDGTPDYLDDDDDGDGTLTRYEDTNGDLDPTNDITDPSVGADYLNPNITTETIIDEYRTHTYNLKSDISLILSNLVLINGEEQITQETMDIGNIEDVLNLEVIITPPF